MAEGINIKILPQVGSALGNERILIGRNIMVISTIDY
jgi:hypothetical protein